MCNFKIVNFFQISKFVNKFYNSECKLSYSYQANVFKPVKILYSTIYWYLVLNNWLYLITNWSVHK